MDEREKTNREYPLAPIDSARFVMERSLNVSIDRSKVETIAKQITKEIIDGSMFDEKDEWLGSDTGPSTRLSDEDLFDWIFFVSSLNFSFWIDEISSENENDHQSYTRDYKGKTHHGFLGFCASVNKSLDDGIDLINPRFYMSVSLDQLVKIFGSNLPMIEDRQRVLHETGSILVQKFDGHFYNCFKQSGNNAVDIVRFVVETFPSYRDETFYEGQKVSFYKRAQILVGDIWSLCKSRSIVHLTDLDRLTMFADYRVPQVLSHDGVLVYSDGLKERLARRDRIEFGSRDEVEIRAGSILAVDLIVNRVNDRIPLERDIGDQGQRINSIIVDVFLWKKRRSLNHQYKTTPFHRTRSIFY